MNADGSAPMVARLRFAAEAPVLGAAVLTRSVGAALPVAGIAPIPPGARPPHPEYIGRDRDLC